MMRSPHHITATARPARQTPRRLREVRLRRVVGVIFLSTMVVLTGALYAAARSTLLVGFGEVERREANRNVERARAAMDELLAAMSSKTSDWAAWDDTCNFVADR